jgi:hypothetical protein
MFKTNAQMNDLEQTEALTAALKRLKAAVMKRENLSAKQSSYTLENSTDRQRGKASTDLNWQCMEVEKKKIDVARLFKNGCCDVGTETRHFTPSGFHEYQY